MIFRKPTTVIVQIQAKIVWQLAQDPESKVWIGVCPDLNLNAEGDTFPDVLACAGDAMKLLFQDLFEENELDTYLQRRGWRRQGDPVPGAKVRFDTPFDFTRVPIGAIATATA